MPTQNVFDGDLILEYLEGRLIWRNLQTKQDIVRIVQVLSDPNGVVSAPLGSFAVGPGGPWVNIDGATGWVSLAGGTSSAVEINTNTVVPLTARSLFFDTTDGELQAWLPLVSDFDGTALFVRHAEGNDRVQLVPAGGDAVNGPEGNPMLVYPLEGYTLLPDFTRNTWWVA